MFAAPMWVGGGGEPANSSTIDGAALRPPVGAMRPMIGGLSDWAQRRIQAKAQDNECNCRTNPRPR